MLATAGTTTACAHTAEESSFFPDAIGEAGSNQLHEVTMVYGLPDFKSYLGLKGDFSRLTTIARNDAVVGESVRSYLDMLPRPAEIENAILASIISSFRIHEE